MSRGAAGSVACAVLALAGCHVVFGVDRGEGGNDGVDDDSCANPVVGDGLLAWYPMDALDGTTLPACVGVDGSCTAGNCPTIDATGPHGRRAQLFTSQRWVDIPALAVGPEFTLAFWMRSDVHSDDYRCPVNKLNLGNGDNAWQFCLLDEVPTMLWEEQSGDGMQQPDDSARVDIAVWMHLAIRWDGHDVVMFRDGGEVARENSNGVVRDAGPLILGGDRDDALNLHFLEGALAGVRFYDRALTDDEVSSLSVAP